MDRTFSSDHHRRHHHGCEGDDDNADDGEMGEAIDSISAELD